MMSGEFLAVSVAWRSKRRFVAMSVWLGACHRSPAVQFYHTERIQSRDRTESIEERREGDRHPVGAIRPGISGLRPPTRICDESPLHHGLYPSFVFVYTVLAGVSTQHAADSPPVRFGAAFSVASSLFLTR